MIRRLSVASVAVASAVVVALAGCSSPTSTPSATTTATASAAPTAPASSAPVPTQISNEGAMSFADGNALSTDVAKAPTFLNGFVNPTSGWKNSTETDSKNGKYVYTSDEGLCTATLLQLKIDKASFDMVKGDDKTSSTNALVWYFSSTPKLAQEVPEAAADATLPFGTGWEAGDAGTDFRGVSAPTTNGGAFATYARAFAQPSIALFAQINCTTTDAFAKHAQSALLDSGVIVE